MASNTHVTDSVKVAFVLKGYPRLSETFIAQEIRALEARGLNIEIWSLRHPTDKLTHPITAEIKAQVNYLPEYLRDEPLRVLKAWWQVRRLKEYPTAFKIWREDWKRDSTTNRVRRFGQACVLAAECRSSIQQLHAHFLHTPASVTRYAAIMTERPWSCSAHAKDIWTSPKWELKEKLQSLQWLSTCTQYNVDYLSKLAAPKQCVFLNYHGLDLERFNTATNRVEEKITFNQSKDTPSQSMPVKFLSVGRAVPKKGYIPLLKVLSALPKHLDWQFTHIGGGPLLDEMRSLAEASGMGKRVQFLGAQAQQQVLEAYRNSDVFLLNSTVDESGDRDGLPNVLLEAQSQSLAVITTSVSGIPELVVDGVNGLLVEDGDNAALLKAIEWLATDGALRKRLGENGKRRVNELFSLNGNIEALHDLFKQSLQESPA